ncbi:Cardiolipin [Brachionus plicatilis]|uniref:cardiolipin synthase (CMP-forming) n=1 Tax=Brachionus plicatilis TaxID=10195 RepID=A0A3M7Q302_BRAPC|nr:Cardiolipin [Brachionus plicatilis]
MRILTNLTFNKHLLASINHNPAIRLNKRWLKISRFVSAPSQKQPDPENVIFTVPNALTLSRIASVPFINYFVFTDQHELACSLFVLAGVTDFVDGFIARNFRNQKSYLGSVIDPLADKLLIGSLTITLMLNSMIPIPLAGLILARDLSLIMYSIYVRFKLIQKPVTLRKFLNLKQSRVKVEADMISKVNTFFQISLIAATLPSQVFLYEDSYYLVVLQLATGLTTLMSSISYAYKKGSYKAIDKAKNK